MTANPEAANPEAAKPGTAKPGRGPAAVRKHSLVISGHPTSISLEDAFWTALQATAKRRGLSVAGLAAEIDARRGAANLSSAIRVFLLETARNEA